MKLIYLACPYSGTAEVIEKRMRVFCRVVAQMQLRGDLVISPLLMHFVLEYEPKLANDWNFWKTYSRELLSRCDELHILALRGWEDSTGIKGETAIAEELGKPIHLIPDPM